MSPLPKLPTNQKDTPTMEYLDLQTLHHPAISLYITLKDETPIEHLLSLNQTFTPVLSNVLARLNNKMFPDLFEPIHELYIKLAKASRNHDPYATMPAQQWCLDIARYASHNHITTQSNLRNHIKEALSVVNYMTPNTNNHPKTK